MSTENLKPEACPRCEKPSELCFCSEIEALPNRLPILILQHPQEPDKLLGTARIANLSLQNSVLKVGLSWPNLAKALGRPVNEQGRWGILFLKGEDKKKAEKRGIIANDSILRIFGKGTQEYELGEFPIEGIVILDGTWAQAKTLWWRNPWMLKLKRMQLNPKQRSIYGDLRREPKRECLSTIESIAEVLEIFGEKQAIPMKLREHITTLLKKYRTSPYLGQKKLSAPQAEESSSNEA
jgi:DTW domain-containing protein YfiP